MSLDWAGVIEIAQTREVMDTDGRMVAGIQASDNITQAAQSQQRAYSAGAAGHQNHAGRRQQRQQRPRTPQPQKTANYNYQQTRAPALMATNHAPPTTNNNVT
jgi:hypothetical protein